MGYRKYLELLAGKDKRVALAQEHYTHSDRWAKRHVRLAAGVRESVTIPVRVDMYARGSNMDAHAAIGARTSTPCGMCSSSTPSSTSDAALWRRRSASSSWSPR